MVLRGERRREVSIRAGIAFAVVLGVLPLRAEDAAAPGPPRDPAAAESNNDHGKALAAMRALETSIADTEAAIVSKRAALSAAALPEEREKIAAEIAALNENLAAQRADFEGFATGIDLKSSPFPSLSSLLFSLTFRVMKATLASKGQ